MTEGVYYDIPNPNTELIFGLEWHFLNDEKVDVKYKFCNNFEEATTLMYFQSDWFLKNSQIIIIKKQVIRK